METTLSHHGILGQKWGVRRYQNKDGTWTSAGKKRYGDNAQETSKTQNNTKKKVAIGIAAGTATVAGVVLTAYLVKKMGNKNISELADSVENGKKAVEKILETTSLGSTPVSQLPTMRALSPPSSDAAKPAAEKVFETAKQVIAKAEVETLGAQATADKNAAEDARDAAKASQDAAAGSAAGAAVSAGDAATAQNNAEDAQAAAEAAQAAAEAAKTAAEDSEKKAKDFETNAAKSASDASESADTAKQYSGKSPKPIDGTWWTWNAANGQYEDTGITCELVGPTGNGIESIIQKSGDHMPGSTDVYEIKMTDGTTREISVHNGKNGTGIGDVQGIGFDIELPVGGWINGKVTIHDDRFVASARYKYFVDTYDECRDEVNESKIKPQDITANGYMTFTTEYTPLSTVMINIVRLEVNGSGEPA